MAGANDAFAHLLGYPNAATVVELTTADFVDPSSLPDRARHYATLVETPMSTPLTAFRLLLTATGSRLRVWARMSLVETTAPSRRSPR